MSSALPISWSQLLAVAGASALAGPVLAGAPTSFDQWNITNGSVTATCPAGFGCDVSISDPGFMQRMITDGTGRQYVQQIIADTDVSGTTIASESFIDATGTTTANGIASKTTLQDPAADNFASSAQVNTGWAVAAGEASKAFHQGFDTGLTAGSRDVVSFDLYQYRDATDTDVGMAMDIRQDAVDTTAIGNGTTGQSLQSFVYRERQGTAVTSAGSATLPGDPTAATPGDLPRGGTVNWSAGDDITAVWNGTLCEGCQGNGTAATFSYQAYDNRSDNAAPINSFSIIGSAPFGWDPVFGTEPSLGPPPAQ